jgi:hypothetical protein
MPLLLCPEISVHCAADGGGLGLVGPYRGVLFLKGPGTANAHVTQRGFQVTLQQ